MPWWIGTICGAIALVILNSLKKGMDLTFWNFLVLFPILVCVQFGFWYGFRHGENFLAVWFTGSVLTASFAVAASILVFHEPLTMIKCTGVGCCLIGVYLLK